MPRSGSAIAIMEWFRNAVITRMGGIRVAVYILGSSYVL